ncbi:MAG: sodium/solute symporter [Planctomycetota bacterium]
MTLDTLIVVIYLAGAVGLGLWLGRNQKSVGDYFLGARSLPGWAVLLSIVATETSTVTFLSVPGLSFNPEGGDFRFLQITFGYVVGRLAIVAFLLPLFFRGQAFTAYELMERRYGVTTRRLTSVLFLITRNLADALRLFLTAIVLQQAIGLDVRLCVIVIGVVTIGYTVFGGVKSVVWNDCIQFMVYTLGALAAVQVLGAKTPGGWNGIFEFAQEADKLRVFDLRLSPADGGVSFWAGLLGGAFLTAATHGTDQMMVQRYLAARSRGAAGWALGLSGFVVMAQFALFLLIGVGMACFYASSPPDGVPVDSFKGDVVFSHFIVNHLGRGLVGLTLAAVFAAAMSTLSSSLNSSATTLIKDVVVPCVKTPLSDPQQLKLGRAATALFGVVQITLALAGYGIGIERDTVNAVLKIASFVAGPMLGLYIIAAFGPRLALVGQSSMLSGLGVGFVVVGAVAQRYGPHWLWYSLIGALVTIACALVLAVLTPKGRGDEDA